MVLIPRILIASGLACSLTPAIAAAQDTACTGPGAAFGITSYRCEKCGVDTKEGRIRFIFDVEPEVLSVRDGSLVQKGDVIVAVNGRRITTAEGADAFTYPAAGVSVIVVRRNGQRVEVRAERASDCGGTAPQSDALLQRARQPIDQRVERVQPSAGPAAASTQNTGQFGFAVGCRPSCTKTRASDGTDYWKFDGEPPLVAVRQGTPAERAGLRVGDVLLEVDGQSVRSEEGALRLLRSQSRQTVTLTVRRDGERLTFTLTGPRK